MPVRLRLLVAAVIATTAFPSTGQAAAPLQPTCGPTFTFATRSAAGSGARVGYQPATVVARTDSSMTVQTPSYADGPAYPVEIDGELNRFTVGYLRNGCFSEYGETNLGPGIRAVDQNRSGPAQTSAAGGERVSVLVGGPTQPAAELRFGGVPGTEAVSTPNMVSTGGDEDPGPSYQQGWRVTANAPARGVGWVDLSVVVAGEEVFGQTVASDDLEYIGPRGIRSLTPAQGPVAGGTRVTLSFGRSGPASTKVRFGISEAEIEGSSVSTNTADGTFGDEYVTVIAPPGLAGVVDVSAVDAGSNILTGATSTADDFRYVESATITSVLGQPTSSGGGFLTIVGQRLGTVRGVKVGETPGRLVLAGPTRAYFRAPPLPPGLYSVTVTLRDGTQVTSEQKIAYGDNS